MNILLHHNYVRVHISIIEAFENHAKFKSCIIPDIQHESSSCPVYHFNAEFAQHSSFCQRLVVWKCLHTKQLWTVGNIKHAKVSIKIFIHKILQLSWKTMHSCKLLVWNLGIENYIFWIRSKWPYLPNNSSTS